MTRTYTQLVCLGSLFTFLGEGNNIEEIINYSNRHRWFYIDNSSFKKKVKNTLHVITPMY